MEGPPKMKPRDGLIQAAGYKKQDIRYKDEGMQQAIRSGVCDVQYWGHGGHA
jgi:hypothetical protein